MTRKFLLLFLIYFCSSAIIAQSIGLNFAASRQEYVSLSSNPIQSATNFTYEFWVYPKSSTAWQRTLDFSSTFNANFATKYMFFTPYNSINGKARFVINDGTGEQFVDGSALLLNTWSHVAVTLNAFTRTATMYVNGNLAGQNTNFTFTPSSVGPTSNVMFGRSSFKVDPYLNAILDEVRFWNVTRTQTEIQTNKNCDVAQQSGLVAYYRLEDGVSNASNTGKTIAYDYSGNNNCGSLINFALSGTTSNWTDGAIGSCNPITISASSNTYTISTQPRNTSISTNVTLTVAASGTGTINYQWQESTDNGVTFTNIYDGGIYGGATTNTLTLTNPSNTYIGYQYRCIVQPPCSSVLTSNAATIVLGIITNSSLTTFTTCAGKSSASQNFTVSGSGLSANIIVTAPTGYEISLSSNSGYTNSITLTQSGGSVANTTVYVRLSSTATGAPSGNITVTSTSATTQNIAVNGTVNLLPTISLGTVSSVLTNSTSFSLPYSSTTGNPNQYSITTGTPTPMSGFTIVNNATITTTPLSVTIPTSPVGTYNFNLSVTNSATGCTSINNPFTVTVVQFTIPQSISGLQMWLDGSDVNNTGTNPSNNTTITTWKDKSGAGRDATVLAGQSGGVLTTNQINGQSVVRFNRTDDFNGSVYEVQNLDIRAQNLPQMTIFTVYKQGALTTAGAPPYDQAIWGCDNGGWDRFFFTSFPSLPGSNLNGGVANGTYAVSIPNAANVGATQLLTAAYDYNVNNSSAVYFNGVKLSDFTDNTHPSAAQPTLRIGWDGDNNTFNGDIAEMLVYNRKLTACEIQTINRYLGAKYGVTFSTVTIDTSGPTTFNTGGSVTLTSHVTGAAYQWLKDGAAISGANSQSYLATISGNYQVVVTNSCNDTSSVQVVTVKALGIGLDFSGSKQEYVSLSANPVQSATNFTYEFWIYPKSGTAWQRTLDFSSTFNANFATKYMFFTPYNSINGKARFVINDGTGEQVVDGSVLNLNTWYHLAVTLNATTKTATMYVNGAPVGQNTNFTFTPSSVGATSNVMFGRSSFKVDPYLNATLDEVRLWNVTRTQTQIQANMNCDVAQQAGLVGYYRLDDGIAGTTNAGKTVAYDYSGNNNCGSLINFALAGTTSNWVTGSIGSCNTIATNLNSNSYSIGTQPSNSSISSIVTFSVAVTGTGTINYQWQESTDNGVTFTNIYDGGIYSGATTSMLTLTSPSNAYIGYQYRCIVQPSCASTITSNVARVVAGITIGGGSSLTPFLTCAGTASPQQSFTVSGSGLSADLVITAPTGFEVSKTSGSGFGASVTLPQSGGTVATTTIYVRLSSAASGSPSGNIAIASTGATTQNVAVSGTANPLPTASISAGGATTFCQGGSVTLTASTGTSYLWSTGATTASINASTTGNYTVTVTNANGCSATSAATTVTVNPLPTASISAGSATTFCQGGSVTLTASTGTSYLWSTGATTVSINASTTGNYTVTVTNANGCSATSAATTVTVNPLPTASISAGSATTFCQGGSVTLTATTGASYLWSTGATTASINASTSGNYTVTVTNANGCSATSAATTVTVNPLPTASISAGSATTFCQGGSVTLTATTGASYLWSTGATTASTNVSTSGNYTVRVTNASGCSATSAATTVTVNPLPVANISAASTVICGAGNSTNLTATGGATYQWSRNGTPISGATGSTYAATTIGTYTATATSAFGCIAPATGSLVVTQLLAPKAGFTYDSYCTNKAINFTNTSMVNTTGAVSYTWSDNNANTSSATNARFTYPNAGSYSVKLKVQSNTCSNLADSVTVVVPVEAPRVAIRQTTLDVAINDNVQLQARNFGNQYAWSPSLGLSDPFISNPTINTSKEQEYLITIGVPSGCTTIDTLKVRIHESNKIYVPNVFSPNGDGQNDKLYLIPVGISELKSYRIFNRWGKKLFETSSISQGWDGTFNGQLQPLDTYVWTVLAVDKNGNTIHQEGTVTLLR